MVVLLPLIFSSLYCGIGGNILKHTRNFLTSNDFCKLILSGVASITSILICMGTIYKVGRLITVRIFSTVVGIVTVGLFFCVNEQFTIVVIMLLKLVAQVVNTAL